MIITQNQFQQKYKEGILKIAFIGMSNIGKTYRSKELQVYKNFNYHSIDEAIEKKLEPILQKENLSGIKGLATWMGYPYDSEFSITQEKYLKLEEECMMNIELNKSQNIILDTTGSVVYLSKQVLKFLKDNFLVFNFDVSANLKEVLLSKFFKNPKPVVWQDSFCQNKDEDGTDAIIRCYPQLLANRIKQYRKIADVNLFSEISSSSEIDIDRFWEVLELSLPS